MNLSKTSVIQHVINIISIVVTCILLYNDFTFFLSKPTFSSNSKGSLHPQSFPDIMLCPFPAFDFSKFHNLRKAFKKQAEKLKSREIKR